jgi:hypothetical protein
MSNFYMEDEPMEQIVITVKDKRKAELLRELLRALDFVEIVDIRPVAETNDIDFFALAGLWAGRDITQQSLRRQAWPQRS